MPEVNFWKEIRNRLSNYREEPDDDWDRIAGALDQPQKDYSGLNRLSDFTVLILLAFLIGVGVGQSGKPKALPSRLDLSNSAKVQQQKKSEEEGFEVSSAKKDEPLPVQKTTNSAISNMDDRDEDNVTKLNHIVAPIAGMKEQVLETFDHAENESNTITTSPGENKSEAAFSQESVRSKTMVLANDSSPTETVMIDTLESDSISKKEEVAAAFAPKKENKKKVKKFHPSVFASITPTLGFYKLVPSKDDQVEILSLRRSPILSGERFGIQLNVGFEHHFTPKLKAYAGLSFSKMHQVIHYSVGDRNSVQVQSQNDGSYLVTPAELEQIYDYRIRGFGFNAGLLYTISKGALQHKVGGGIQYHSGKSTSGAEQATLTSRYLSYQLIYRVEYPLRPNVGLFVQPTYTRSFNVQESVDGPFKVKPHYGGIGFGLIYHF